MILPIALNMNLWKVEVDIRRMKFIAEEGGYWTSASPSPRPSPLGEGESFANGGVLGRSNQFEYLSRELVM